MDAARVWQLAQVFQKYPDIQAVYLFGSQATGRPREESDLDLAIVPRHARLREKRLDILADLARHGFCNVDLVFLDTKDIVLQYEAVRENRLVYQAADFDRGTTYSRIVRMYLDFLPYLRVQREAYKRRILGGRPEMIRKRLNKLDEYLEILRRLQRYTLEEFLADPERYGSAERFLQLAIEAVTDMGNHVIAALDLGVVDWYSDIPRILAEKGHLSPDLAEKWIRILGFRNVLVHEYLDIDRRIVYEALQRDLQDLEALRMLFARFL